MDLQIIAGRHYRVQMEHLRHGCILGVPDDSVGTAFRRAAEATSGRSREDAVGRSQEEAGRDVGFVLSGCGMSTSTDAYLWRTRLPPKAAARLAA